MPTPLLGHDLRSIALDDTHAVFVGTLPPSLVPDAVGFAALWSTHPSDFHEIKMHGRPVRTPRWQQAYGADYRYTGNTNRALAITPLMMTWLAWSRERTHLGGAAHREQRRGSA